VRIREISGKGLCLFSVPLMRAGLGAFGPIGPADPGLLTHIKGQRHAESQRQGNRTNGNSRSKRRLAHVDHSAGG
jgi:hypothetical protein